MAVISLLSAADLEDFCAFLRAAHVHVSASAGTTVEATVPGASSDMHERRELAGYVATWNALNPGRDATILDD